MRILIIAILIALFAGDAFAQVRLRAAVLPATRVVETGTPATVFATLINAGDQTASQCRIALDSGFSGPVPVNLSFQTVNAVNQLTGSANTPVDIPAGAAQGFLITLTPTGEIAARDIGFDFVCDEGRAPVTEGVNTLRLTASDTSLPDIIAIGATLSGDGVLRIESAGGRQAMAAAALNIGDTATVTVRPVTGRYAWPIDLEVCETGPDGRCLSPPVASLPINFASGETRTFTVFARGDSRLGIPLMPDIARVFLNFEAEDGSALGATSAALFSPQPVRDYAPLNLQAARDQAFVSGARAVLIMRDGEVLLEDYRGIGAADRAEILNSGTKSFSCLLAGVARDDGLFNPDDYAFVGISAWAPDGTDPWSPVKQDIRGRDLIALSHGLSPGPSAGDISGFDSYEEAINIASIYRPDRNAIYGRSGFQAFSALFELRTGGEIDTDSVIQGGRDPATYLDDRLLSVIDAVPAWNRDINGNPNFSAGAALTARNWANFGRFVLDDGMWDSQRLLTRSSIRRCLHYASPAYLGYGLGFWLNRDVGDSYDAQRDALPPETRVHMPTMGRIFPAAPDDMVSAWGAFNMQMHLIRSENLVIVKFGGSGDQNVFFETLFATSP